MRTQAQDFLKRRLTRLKSDHIEALRHIGNNALKIFIPTSKKTYGTSLQQFIRDIQREIATYTIKVIAEIKDTVVATLLPMSEEEMALVIKFTFEIFDESLYPKQLKIQEESMERQAGRFGIEKKDWGVRNDIEYAKLISGTSNQLSRAMASLSDEITLIRLINARSTQTSTLNPQGGIMNFSDLMNDNVDVLKADGTKIIGKKASVQRSKIHMDAKGLLVEPNDLIIRRMSNGAEETYRVIDPGFYEGFHGIPANYQMDVHKLGLPEAKSAVKNITYNVSGANARINNNSTDNSTNISQTNSEVIKDIRKLREGIKSLDISDCEKQEAIEIIDEVEESFRSGQPKRSVVSALLKSLPHLANITAIGAAILSVIPK